MPLSVECQECGTKYNVPDKLAGKRAKCKKCGTTMSIPEPDVAIGFAPEPEEDPLAALQDLARQSGELETPPDVAPAAPRSRTAAGSIAGRSAAGRSAAGRSAVGRPAAGGSVHGAPAGWTPDSVVVEKAPSAAASGPSAAGSGRWAKRASPVDPDFLSRLIAFLYVGVTIGLGAYLHSLISGKVETRGIVALWSMIGGQIVLFFAVAVPMTMLGALIGAKIFGQYLVAGAYTRAAGVACAAMFITVGLVFLMVARALPADATIPVLLVALVIPVTFVLVKLLFEMTLAQTIVAWVLCGILGTIGTGIANRVSSTVAMKIGGVDGDPRLAFAGKGGRTDWLMGGTSGKTSETTKTTDPGRTGGTQQQQQQPKPPPTENEQKRNESAEKLKQIYAALNNHLAATNRNWPTDLASLQRDQGLDAQVLTSPFGPAFAAGDYVYTPFVPETVAGPEVVLAYDNAELSNGEGASVLFGTGEVRWLAKDAVQAALAQSQGIYAAAKQQRDQTLAMRLQQQPQQSPTSPTVVDGGPGQDGGADAQRLVARGDVAERIKSGARGFVAAAHDVAVRRGTEQLVRAITPASAVALLVRGTQGDTVEVFDAKAAEPVATADFQTDQQFRSSPGGYALSPDGKSLARLASWPKLQASVYSFEKKAEAHSIDLDEKFGEPSLVGFMSPDLFVVRWQKLGEYGIEVWNAKTGKRGRQLPLFRVDPPPSPGSEAVSPDGRTYALVNRAAPANAPRGRAGAATQQGMQVLLYDVIGGATQPRRFQVPVLGNQPGVSAAGLAFSPNKQRLALLLVDNQGRAVVVQWNMATGKPLPEHALAERVDLPRVGFGRVRGLDYVADGRALLVAGRTLINPDTGATLAVLEAGKVHGQAVTDDSTVHLTHGDSARLEGLAVITLVESKLPEKPGTPGRAVAAPAR